MSKTVTLRLSDEDYAKLSAAAKAEKRSLSNLISLLALRKLEEDAFVSELEMNEILSDENLVERLHRGIGEAAERKGSFVDL